MKKYIATTLFCFGLLSIPQTKAALFTHSLNYRQLDAPGDTLTATVTFDDTQVPGSTIDAAFDSNFVTDITYVYTPSGGNALTLNYAAFTAGDDFDKFSFVPKSGVTVNFATMTDDALYDQLDNLQFGNSGQAFNLTINATAFRVDATDGISSTDFILEGSSYVSPAPLPLLGLIPAFSSIAILKKRYKSSINT